MMLVLAASGLLAQTFEQKRDEKLKEPWIKDAPWITDYDQARAEAKKNHKPIFAYFTRSYAF